MHSRSMCLYVYACTMGLHMHNVYVCVCVSVYACVCLCVQHLRVCVLALVRNGACHVVRITMTESNNNN